MNILEEFYYGSIKPQKCNFKHSSDYESCIKIIAKCEQKLLDFLSYSPSELQVLERLIEARDEANFIAGCERFICGWRLGARFILDSFIVE